MNKKTECACVADETADGRLVIHSCPLHDAAADLLAALTAILANDGSSGTFSALRNYDAHEMAAAAIAKATGGSK